VNKKTSKLIRLDSRGINGKVDMREYRFKKKVYMTMSWLEKTKKLKQIRRKLRRLK
jgi:hypothetical protein